MKKISREKAIEMAIEQMEVQLNWGSDITIYVGDTSDGKLKWHSIIETCFNRVGNYSL